jgi:hypothetical protein
MSIVTDSSVGQLRSRIFAPARRSVVIGALGAAMLLGGALVVEAAPLPQHPCTSQLENLLTDWSAAGFETPAKPSQAIVHGQNGRISSGPEVDYNAGQIRQAVWDCQHGDTQAVRGRVAHVTGWLESTAVM